MTDEPLRLVIERVLQELRPEADLVSLPPAGDLRDELDLDSLDFLNLVIGIHEATGVDIPETDYKYVRTLDDCVEYLGRHSGGP